MSREPSSMAGQAPHGTVAVVGGGPAGMAASLALAHLGHEVVLIESSHRLGGRAARLSTLLPDRRSAGEEIGRSISSVEEEHRIKVLLSREVVSLTSNGDGLDVELDDGSSVHARSVLLAIGLDEVPASLVPEYGHGLRKGVVTSIEMEDMLRSGKLEGKDGPDIASVVFVQCVGSRTERRGVPYCSALCCASAVKNALEARRLLPDAQVTVLYIDLRTSGPGQEALYRDARRQGVRFIRGQPSMVLEKGGRLLVCGENTLLRELYEIPADLVVLGTGLRQSPANLLLLDLLEVRQGTSGFPAPDTGVDGVLICGSAAGPMDLPSTVAHARSAALEAHERMVRKKEREKGLGLLLPPEVDDGPDHADHAYDGGASGSDGA